MARAFSDRNGPKSHTLFPRVSPVRDLRLPWSQKLRCILQDQLTCFHSLQKGILKYPILPNSVQSRSWTLFGDFTLLWSFLEASTRLLPPEHATSSMDLSGRALIVPCGGIGASVDPCGASRRCRGSISTSPLPEPSLELRTPLLTSARNSTNYRCGNTS